MSKKIFILLLYITGLAIITGCGPAPTQIKYPTVTPRPTQAHSLSEITGKILTANGANIGGAYIVCTNTSLNSSVTTYSSASGEYNFKDLPAGFYRLAFWKSLSDYNNSPGSPAGAVNATIVKGINKVNISEGTIEPTPTPTFTATPTLTATPTPTITPTLTATPLPDLTITDFTPKSALIGTLISINGNAFDNTCTVKMGGVLVNSTYISSNLINVTLPAEAISGPISITKGNSTVSSTINFTMLHTINSGSQDYYTTDGTPVPVTLSSSIYAGTYEVTRAEYCSFLNDISSVPVSNNVYDSSNNLLLNINTSGITYNSTQSPKYQASNGNYPVSCTWYGSVAYCNWLSIKENLSQYYGAGYVYKFPETNGYRLQTSDEWSYICLAGRLNSSYNKYWWEAGESPINTNTYNNWNNINGNVISVKDTTGGKTYCNNLGIYHITGNVWEWTNTADIFNEVTCAYIRGGGCYTSVVTNLSFQDEYVHTPDDDGPSPDTYRIKPVDTNWGDLGFRVVRYIQVPIVN